MVVVSLSVVVSSAVVVLSLVVDASSSLLLLQEMKMELKRNRERIVVRRTLIWKVFVHCLLTTLTYHRMGNQSKKRD